MPQKLIRQENTTFRGGYINNPQDINLSSRSTMAEEISRIFEIDRRVLEEIYDDDFQEGKNVDKPKLFAKNLAVSTNDAFSQRDFDANINNDPYRLRKENTLFTFALIENYMKDTDNEGYEKMMDLLDTLSEGIYVNDNKKVSESWGSIIQMLREYWADIYLPRALKTNESNQNTIQAFIDSPFAKKPNNADLIDQIFKSEAYSPEEKLFLIQKMSQPHGYDLCKFLISRPPNDSLRKQIIDNIILSEKIADENYTQIKEVFTNDVQKGDMSSELLNIKVHGRSLVDLVIEKTPAVSELNFMEFPEKIDYLKRLPKEELLSLLEANKKDWVLDKSIEAYENETLKYDINSRFDDIVSRITIDTGEGKINIADIANQGFNDMFKKEATLETLERQALEAAQKHDKDTKAQFRMMSQELDAIYKLLSENTKEAKAFQIQVSAALDKLIKQQPAKKKEIEQTRSTLQKIKDGILGVNNLPTSAFALNYLFNIGKTLTRTGEPTSATLGAALLFVAFASRVGASIHYEFKKG